MPFDGTGYEDRFEALEKIDKVIDLLGDERRWCMRGHAIKARVTAIGRSPPREPGSQAVDIVNAQET